MQSLFRDSIHQIISNKCTPNRFFREKPKTRDLLPANLVKSHFEVGEDDKMGRIYRNCICRMYIHLVSKFNW